MASWSIVTTCRTIDHHLVARVSSLANGANAHELHALIGNYLALAEFPESDAMAQRLFQQLETKLRALGVREALETLGEVRALQAVAPFVISIAAAA